MSSKIISGSTIQQSKPDKAPSISGNDLNGPDNKPAGSMVPLPARHTFSLAIGADHTDMVKWGLAPNGVSTSAAGRGYMQLLLDGGLKPYLAVTTGTGAAAHVPEQGLTDGALGGMSWTQLKTLQDRGVEIASHSHQHIQRWDRLNTGVYISYNGAGTTGTISISATTITLTVTGTGSGTDSATLTRSNYTTLAEVLAAINAINGTAWDAKFRDDAALTGIEPQSCLLPISGARNVKSAGAPNINNRLFCCGGGLHVWCGNTGALAQIPEHVRFTIRTNGWLVINIDGVSRYYGDLAGAATDTFAELAAVLNTAFNASGLYFGLADNGQTVATGTDTDNFLNYMRGDELCASLKGLTTRVVTPSNMAITPAVIEVGLTQNYIRERQFTKSIEVAAAHGIKLKAFAEPGNNYWPWHMQGFNKFEAHRGTLYSRLDQQPITYPLAALNTPFFVRSSCIHSGGYTTNAHMEALVEAMADSPGHATCLLWHGLSTGGGNLGYELGVDLSLQDQDTARAKAFLDALKPHLASGKITPTSLSTAAASVSAGREPFNRIFNANFKTANLPIPTTNGVAYINNNHNIPGWITNLSATSGATATVRSDGMIVLSSPGAVADFSIRQSVILERGVDWEYGMDIRDANVTAGTGVVMNVLRTQGRALNGNNLEANTSIVTAISSAGNENGTANGTTTPGLVAGRLTLTASSTGFDAARIVGVVGPFNIVTGTNDVISIAINSINPGAALTLTPGAARTAVQIVAEIQAWIQADSVFSTYPEFWNIAKARRGGRASPVIILGDLQNVNKVAVTSSNTNSGCITTLFGGVHTGIGHIADGYTGPDMDSALFAVTMCIQANFQGTLLLGRPYTKRLEMM